MGQSIRVPAAEVRAPAEVFFLFVGRVCRRTGRVG